MSAKCPVSAALRLCSPLSTAPSILCSEKTASLISPQSPRVSLTSLNINSSRMRTVRSLISTQRPAPAVMPTLPSTGPAITSPVPRIIPIHLRYSSISYRNLSSLRKMSIRRSVSSNRRSKCPAITPIGAFPPIC